MRMMYVNSRLNYTDPEFRSRYIYNPLSRYFRPTFNIISWFARPSEGQNRVLANLTEDQIAANTTRGTTPGPITPGNPNGGWVPLPATYHDHGSRRGKISRKKKAPGSTRETSPFSNSSNPPHSSEGTPSLGSLPIRPDQDQQPSQNLTSQPAQLGNPQESHTRTGSPSTHRNHLQVSDPIEQIDKTTATSRYSLQLQQVPEPFFNSQRSSHTVPSLGSNQNMPHSKRVELRAGGQPRSHPFPASSPLLENDSLQSYRPQGSGLDNMSMLRQFELTQQQGQRQRLQPQYQSGPSSRNSKVDVYGKNPWPEHPFQQFGDGGSIANSQASFKDNPGYPAIVQGSLSNNPSPMKRPVRWPDASRAFWSNNVYNSPPALGSFHPPHSLATDPQQQERPGAPQAFNQNPPSGRFSRPQPRTSIGGGNYTSMMPGSIPHTHSNSSYHSTPLSSNSPYQTHPATRQNSTMGNASNASDSRAFSQGSLTQHQVVAERGQGNL